MASKMANEFRVFVDSIPTAEKNIAAHTSFGMSVFFANDHQIAWTVGKEWQKYEAQNGWTAVEQQ